MASNQPDDDSPNSNESGSNLRGDLDNVKKVATGGMAHIFRARQPSLDRYIAVKKLREELMIQPEILERFRREARALASVLHQNVAHVYDFVESGRESYILMEFIEGIDVSDVIEKLGNIPAEVAAAILLCVARGVNYIHNHHLIHRDIKPSNIRITTRGEVKLMDFGIVMDVQNGGLTRPGMMVGSPSYLSPEQVLGDNISPKADIFLMGICLYEMVTGTRPFKDDQKGTVFQKIRESDYVPARKMNAKVPLVIEKIIKKCLQRDPEKRYQSVRAVIDELETFLGTGKSTHTEQIILKYLDGEALLSASIPVLGYEEDATTQGRKAMKWVVAALCAFGIFAGGFFIGKQFSNPASTVSRDFPPPRSQK